MFTPSRTGLALALALAYPLLALPARAQTAAATDDDTSGGSVTAAPATQRVEISSQRQRLDAARNGLSPDTGSSVYRFDQQDIAKLPMGADTPLNQVILQAPGVVQDSYGQLHVRGDHADLQYRIDGIVIPEAIGGFGQALETRFADQLQVLTGALPAQYGYRTAGIVDIHSKGASQQNGGQISLLGGGNGHREGSLELGGSVGALSYYLVGSAMHDDQGIENPTSSRHALHDKTDQGNGFGYFSYVLAPETRVNLILGAANNRFQIPNIPGQTPSYSLAGHDDIDSATLDAWQRERNHFGVLSLQSSLGEDVDYQVAVFSRYTDVHYHPDEVGDLAFNGVAADVARNNRATGLQADASWHLDAMHTLRSGLFYQAEKGATRNNSLVFPADADGNQTSDQPISITDDAQLKGHLWGVYLQDQWQPVKALTVNYGLRYDRVRTVVDEQQLSPRIGLVYDIDAMTRVHAGYARYFTPPPTEQIDQTSIQKFQGTTNALPSDANTAVRSERSNYYDIGIERQFDNHLTVGMDGYYRQVRHLQDEGQFGNALIYSAFNYKRGRVYGLELSATYRDEAFSAYANLAFARAFGKGLESGQFNFEQDEIDYINSNWVHLDHDQATTASAGLSYQWQNGLSTSADLLFGSGLRNGFANRSHLPSYTQVNFSAHRSFDLGSAVGPVDLRLSALNLFDRVYQIRDGSGIGVGAAQYAQRRTVLVGVSKSF